MKSLSSYSKGNDFEQKAFDVINNLLISDNFIYPSKCSKIFRHKKYYSSEREDDIIVDISIETYFNNAKEYSLLTIVECKNYSHAVNISDIEEFKNKMQQIHAHKVFFVTSSNYTKSEIIFAKNSGITLCILKNDALDFVQYRSGASQLAFQDYVYNVMIGENQVDYGFYAMDGYNLFDNLAKMLISCHIIDRNSIKSIAVPYYTKDYIEIEAKKIRETFEPYNKYGVEYQKVVELLKNIYGVYVEEKKINSLYNKEILGKIDFKQNVITISDAIENQNRRIFTLVHEIGHYILHKDILCDNGINNIEDLTIDNNDRRLEFQANLFASYFLVPEDLLMQQIDISFERNRVNRGRLYWDTQQVNCRLAKYVLDELSRYFCVSKEVIKIRMLQNESLIIDDGFDKINSLINKHFNRT